MQVSCVVESCFATLPRTERGTPIVLGGDPKGKNFLYCNGTSVIIRDINVSIALDGMDRDSKCIIIQPITSLLVSLHVLY